MRISHKPGCRYITREIEERMKTRKNIAKFLFGNVSILNIILLTITVFFMFYVLLPRYTMHIFSPPPLVKKNLVPEKPEDRARTLSLSDFSIIGDKNLFHPDREIPVEKKADESAPPMPQPEYILHGTLVSDSVSIAYLEDAKEPRTTSGRGKRQIALHKGDTLSGFTLKEIYPDRVVMVRGKETITVSIADSHKKIKAGQMAHAAPVTETVVPSRGSRNPAIAHRESPARETRKPIRKPIDQDAFNFFQKLKKGAANAHTER